MAGGYNGYRPEVGKGLNMLEKAVAFYRNHRTLCLFLGAGAAYAMFAAYYMASAITNCTQSVMVFPGDNTAGLIAMFSVDNHDPWWGFTRVFSYPYGESLWLPFQLTAQVLFIPFWVLAKAFGPVCGYNILTIIGFVSTALVMFGFTRWLLKGHSAIALLAGYAVAFTPYLQIKGGVHISYLFGGILIASLWLFLKFWQTPNYLWAVLFGVSIASFGYTDGYFILLGGVMASTLVVAACIYEFMMRRNKLADWIVRIRFIAIAVVTAIVLLLPILYVQFHYSSQLQQTLSSTRDSIDREAEVYGARPQEYVLPNALNPALSHVFGDYADRDNHGSNPAENVLSLSLVLVGFALAFAYFVVKKWVDKGKAKLDMGLRLDPRLIVVVLGLVALVAGATSLAPRIGPLITPSAVIIRFVDLWRVFARLSLVVNIALVILAACGLLVVLARIKSRRTRIIVYSLVFAAVFFEYMTFLPFGKARSGYYQAPEIYRWLSQQSEVKDIAEYPLDEFASSGFPVFYNTYQRIHGKNLLNGISATEDATPVRLALRDLESPQTVPALRTLGIDLITVHSATRPGEIPGLVLVHSSNEGILKDASGQSERVWGYRVLDGPHLDYILTIGQGFHAPHKLSATHVVQQMGHHGVLSVKRLLGQAPRDNVGASFVLQSANEYSHVIEIRQGDAVLWSGSVGLDQMTVDFVADPDRPIDVVAVNPVTDATILLSGFVAN